MTLNTPAKRTNAEAVEPKKTFGSFKSMKRDKKKSHFNEDVDMAGVEPSELAGDSEIN